MRNRAARGCLIFLSLLASAATLAKSNDPIPSPPEIRKPEQSKPGEPEAPAQKNQDRTAIPSLTIKEAPAQKAQKESAENAKEADSKTYTDWWMVWLTGILAFVAFLQLVVFGLQARRLRLTIETMEKIGEKQSADMQASIATAQSAADAAMKAARISEIALDSAETPYLYPIVRQFSKEDGDGSSPFSYAFENFGRSPAIVREIYDGSVVSRGLPAVIGFPPPQSNLGKLYVVAAGKCSPWRNMKIQIVGDTNAAAWLIGQVRYSDVFGNQFLSGFCFAINSVSLAFAAYGGAGYNYRRKLTDQERELAETRDADPLVAAAP